MKQHRHVREACLSRHDVEPPQLLNAIVYDLFECGIVAHVGLGRDDPPVERLDLANRLVQVFWRRWLERYAWERLADVDCDDVCAFLSQPHTMTAALAAGGTRDKCDLALETPRCARLDRTVIHLCHVLLSFSQTVVFVVPRLSCAPTDLDDQSMLAVSCPSPAIRSRAAAKRWGWSRHLGLFAGLIASVLARSSGATQAPSRAPGSARPRRSIALLVRSMDRFRLGHGCRRSVAGPWSRGRRQAHPRGRLSGPAAVPGAT